jgi:hypothetical protein
MLLESCEGIIVAVQKRTRLAIDIDPELRRRIKIAAAERDVSLRDYVVQSIEKALNDQPRVESPRGNVIGSETIAQFEKIRADLMRGRIFEDDSTDIINEAREERSRELERISRG